MKKLTWIPVLLFAIGCGSSVSSEPPDNATPVASETPAPGVDTVTLEIQGTGFADATGARALVRALIRPNVVACVEGVVSNGVVLIDLEDVPAEPDVVVELIIDRDADGAYTSGNDRPYGQTIDASGTAATVDVRFEAAAGQRATTWPHGTGCD